MLNIVVKREVTVGNLITATIFVVGILVGIGRIESEVAAIAKQNEEHSNFVQKEQFNQMVGDIRDIRNFLLEHSSEQAFRGPVPASRDTSLANSR